MGIGPYDGVRRIRADVPQSAPTDLADKIIVILPFEGIVSDVFYTDQIIPFITDDMVIVGSLPNASAQFFGNQSFPGTHQ